MIEYKVGDVYRQMYRIRAVEERIAKEYPRGLMRCPTHFSVGQEAGDVAVGMALQAGDKAFSSHRSHGPYLAHGESITKLVAELHGDTAGTTHGRGGSMYLAGGRGQFVASLAVVGAAMGVAAGVALGVKMGKAPRVVVQIDTYRFLEHVGPNEDDSLGYRSRAEVAGAKAIDPLMLLRRDVPPVLAQQIEDETDEVVGQVFAPYGG